MGDSLDNYFVEIDNVDETKWNQILSRFNDANSYQTWHYGIVHYGKENVSWFILRKNDEIVAASLVRIIKIPLIRTKIAYVRWGPLWKLKNTNNNNEVFSHAIRALRKEYVLRRGYILRIYPVLYDDETDVYRPILEKGKFEYVDRGEHKRTLIVDLKPDIEDLRKGLNKKWRNHLSKAEKNQLEIHQGTDNKLFESFKNIYQELIDRKKFAIPNDINKFQLIQGLSPEELKMKILLCSENSEYCGGIIFSAIGETGISIFRAINSIGLKNNAAYLLHWKTIELLKEIGCTSYDLNGINPQKNPGTYKYKKGLCGRNGKDVHFLGKFDSYKNRKFSLLMRLFDYLLLFKQSITTRILKRY